MYGTYIAAAASILSILVKSTEIMEDCDYSHDKRTYICVGITERFPSTYYGHYHLKCKDCHIDTFGYDTFTGTNSLVSFDASESGIHQITTKAFSNLGNLRYLYLQDNHISTIGVEAFFGLRKAYELNIDRNDLVHLTPRFLAGYEGISVSLSENKITEIPPGVFEGIISIMALNMSHNNINNLHKESFKYLEGLEILDLHHNGICYIPLGIFKYLVTLTHLDLSGNKLNSFVTGTFSALSKLSTFNLALNDFDDFDPDVLLPLSDISTLDISSTGLYYLDVNRVRSNAPTLRVLKITDNLWNCGVLTKMVLYLKSVDIDVAESLVGRYDVTNVNGIACSIEVIEEKLPFKEFLINVEAYSNRTVKYCLP